MKPNKAAALERRDCASFPVADRWRGLGEPRRSTDVVSKTGARIYGVMAMALGAGIGGLVLYRLKSRV